MKKEKKDILKNSFRSAMAEVSDMKGFNMYEINKKEAELLVKGYDHVKAPDGITKLMLQKPTDNKLLKFSNIFVLALKENRTLFFTVIISFFFYVWFCPAAYPFFLIDLIVISVLYKLLRKKKVMPYIMLLMATLSYAWADICAMVLAKNAA